LGTVPSIGRPLEGIADFTNLPSAVIPITAAPAEEEEDNENDQNDHSSAHTLYLPTLLSVRDG
jgi:hypothetical protein